jgi:hypothetical protein
VTTVFSFLYKVGKNGEIRVPIIDPTSQIENREIAPTPQKQHAKQQSFCMGEQLVKRWKNKNSCGKRVHNPCLPAELIKPFQKL